MSIEENASETIEQNASKTIDLQYYLKNIIQEANLLTTSLGENITRNLLMGMEEPSQISFLTEIGGSVKLLIGIANPFKTHTENRKDPTIQQTIFHSNQAIRLGHSDQENFPIVSF